MYKRQFKKWGLSKYMKTPEKDRLIQGMCELDQAFSSQRHLQLHKFGDTELRKLIRHIKTELSKRSRRQHGHRIRTAGDLNALPLDGVIAPVDCDISLTKACELSINYSTWQHAEFPAFMTPSSLSQANFSITTANGSVDMRFLFQSVQASCSYFTPDTNGFAAAADFFWRNIKQAIHLLRIASSTRALSTLNEACEAAGNALLAADIGSFVREILTTLSPVNMRACLHVRQQIIQYLIGIAEIKLVAYHPITVVLQQLLFDNPSRDVSERCLAYLANVATSSQDRSALSAAVKSLLSISRLLRKDGEFDNAMRIVQHAYEMAVATFGHNSVEACWALRQKEHICIDTGNYMDALNICFSILGLREFDLAEVRASTEEDIAHIYERLGEMGKRADWLRQAQGNARWLWGDGAATSHIIDKIEGLMTRGIVI
jgi:hypothetical protein